MRIALTVVLLCLAHFVKAQLNATLRGTLDYDIGVNDVWGYVAGDGTEYAIVGLDTAVSVVSLASPERPVEIGRTRGTNSPWRDMKTYGHYAYAVADRGADGLTVIDLSGLPDTITYRHHTYVVPGFDKPFVRAHNLYIDTARGLAFTAGGDFDVNDGGILIFDLRADPAHPPLIAVGPSVYAHDVYVHDSLMYASEIYRGELAIYNIADLSDIREVGRTRTPFTFTHNAWTSDDQQVVFTTDEKANGSVAAFDISDLSDIELLDEYRPLTSIGTRTIPHNVHVIDDFLSVSYYTDGLRVVDASVPDNLIEVANYDTWPGPDGGFNGNWGAYPFLPSGLTLVSDRSTGLYVIDVDYQRAARVKGTVTDAATGAAVNAARLELVGEQLAQDVTDARGQYATGRAVAGSAALVASALGYYPATTVVTLQNGITTLQDIKMRARPRATVIFEVREAGSERPIPDANISLLGQEIDYTDRSGADGKVELLDVYDYDYQLQITAWGYRQRVEAITGGAMSARIYLERGYEDTFVTDLGWQVESTARRGQWERGMPVPTRSGSVTVQPGTDSPSDADSSAYITGNQGGKPEAHDVDGGSTTLISPVLDLSDYGDSTAVSYRYWYTNLTDGASTNDSLSVLLSNGRDTLRLATYTATTSEWVGDTIVLGGRIPLTDSMHLLVIASDDAERDDLVEAGFDDFRITRQRVTTSNASLPPTAVEVTVYPNPTPAAFNLHFGRPFPADVQLDIYDLSGRRVLSRHIPAGKAGDRFGESLNRGGYLGRLTSLEGRLLHTLKLIKQ